MKLHLSTSADQQVISGYGDGYVAVSGIRHETSLVVTPATVTPWPVSAFDALEVGHFALLVELAPEVVVLGTGPRIRFPRPALVRPLVEAGIGLEVMDIGAACRTYNILVGDGRRVAAALLLA